MTPYITFNGISSVDMGLRLVEAEPFIIPRRNRQREYLPGRLGSIASSAFEWPAIGYKLRLAAAGADKSAVVRALHQITNWALSARIMTIWHDPAIYYTGAVEGDASFSMLTKHTGMLEIEFMCDPGCHHRAVGLPDGWTPSLNIPLPEQITDTNNTVMATARTTAFTLSAQVKTTLPPALYLAVTGTWAQLVIGGTLTITQAASETTTLYIDCEAQVVYQQLAGIRTPVRYSGDFPALTNGNLQIDGTAFDITARLLIIERG